MTLVVKMIVRETGVQKRTPDRTVKNLMRNLEKIGMSLKMKHVERMMSGVITLYK